MTITKKSLVTMLVLLPLLFLLQSALIPGPEASAANNLWNNQEGMSGRNDVIATDAFGVTGEPKDIRVIIASVIKVFLGFMGIIFLALTVFAGFKYMTSQGNEDKITEAKSQIKTSIIGLIIILSAYAITLFIASCLTEITSGSGVVWTCR